MSKTTEKIKQEWSRRRFLSHVGLVGGAAAMYETMVAMNLIHVPNQDAPPIEIQKDIGKGQKVVILGAGIGGLTTAHILRQKGYEVTILEASGRAGGRSLTGRKGDKVVEIKDGKRTVSTVNIDEDQYINLGPGRLPYHHRRVLRYCQELGVELQPYIMNTTGNLFQTDQAFDKKAVVYREIQNDTRGYIAELLAKVINQGALDQELSQQDQDRLMTLLQKFGSLEAVENRYGSRTDYIYKGSTRDGCADDPQGNPTPNVYYNCENPKDLILHSLLDAEFWQHSFYDPMEFEWQATLFQPVGGMDMIVEGFKKTVGDLIKYNSPVTKIDVDDDGVIVTFKGPKGTSQIKADYCVSNIPCPILTKLQHNFQPDFAEAVENTTFSPSCKVGWQAEERFWENNEYQIYGGISWTDSIIEQIWYPSNNFFGKKGTLTGAYIHNENAVEFGKLTPKERIARAKKEGAKLHPEIADEKIVPSDKGISIAWQYVEHQMGAWPSWEGNQHDQKYYRRILRPDRRFFIVGDQASTLPGWQEGAMMSAEHVVKQIVNKKPAVIPESVMAPNTKRVVQGIRGSY